MRNLYVLAAALEEIEAHLCEPLRLEDLAKTCHSSTSGLQKLFRYVYRSSVSEYIAKRRLSRASGELACGEKSIMEIAFDYQYGSPEAFSRAFKRFWGISPSRFRRERRFTGLYPKFELEYENGGYLMPNSRKVDIGELYNELKSLKNTCVLCVDVCGLEQTNRTWGYAAGDLVIAEVAARIEQAIPSDMLMFRVGGDEFAVVTGYDKEADVKALEEKIAAHNGKPIVYDGKELPVSARFGMCKIPDGNLRYNELYTKISESLGV